ncbi:PssE/Cps14G family polysaccharide biosynthesis glycosyltransferase [Alkalihalophilus lindianensis]|uniref:PssE/Cps14G family polysaccharide biosynthesis glycosyltransferase n=1 Tax=Alkalihalophilus lindianensis TaxID=1630542 RepID=A0ABU3X8V4_9BACI|nr:MULTISPECIES: PssE/Cps14G family polysaccharide biosynthesis glycosyltransferase [Bacillaceae]KMJ55901.1 exopolysaccharide biosynthesis protein [Bacillus sp. LL01]MDV2684322.1 PssE/Cps14G family polysaccharide biosynthesis glycosyltransferase [Alkalihalophilus lindianensis]
MIFVVLGTHELPFTRLLEEVERLQQSGVITEKIVVQLGHTPYESQSMKLIPFMSYDEMDQNFEEASLIITHAGTGSIITGVKKGKKVIALARRAEFNEHNDDHQVEIVEQFTHAGHILGSDNVGDLENLITREVEGFTPKPYKSGRDHIVKLISEFIETKA